MTVFEYIEKLRMFDPSLEVKAMHLGVDEEHYWPASDPLGISAPVDRALSDFPTKDQFVLIGAWD